MTNFDHFTKEPQFKTFSKIAVNAEKFFLLDPATSAFNSRKSMEFGVKWLYSVEKDLVIPYDKSIFSLLSTDSFRELIDRDLLTRLHFIRKVGNDSAHVDAQEVSAEQAQVCLENLFIFLDFLAYCYGGHYEERTFEGNLLTQEQAPSPNNESELDLSVLLEENKSLKEELSARRVKKQETYQPKSLKMSEFLTRRIYIDTNLKSLGWKKGVNWAEEVELLGMPNKSGLGYADYVLYGDDLKPLAVIEAKKTSKDVCEGRKQGQLYADLLEEKHGVRPVVFLTNGFHTTIDDGKYPERTVASVYSKRDLEKWFNLRRNRQSLKNVKVNEVIAGRYYQIGAITAVCNAFDALNRRKALLVMATGSGKTRTVIGLSEILLEHGWVKNILFLADRTSLLIQAKRTFANLLPNLSLSNVCEKDRNYKANCVFSTYPTIMNCIDQAKDDEGRIYSSGHFDLIICDEVHRSIYNKYKDIFNYFDAPLVGLTATPKEDIDKNTYDIFSLEDGNPTYGYDLAQAVQDGFLVDYMSVETKLKFIERGIIYNELSPEDKEVYEATFLDESGETPEHIRSSALNEWLFNKDTIRKVLQTVMEHGIKFDYGNKIGKTIIFAKNHRHAQEILSVFDEDYPNLKGYAEVIDTHINYAQNSIDNFSELNLMPQIAISVDMLDTGIDVEEVVNLVFFKKVLSKAKFWQMIGRGTRLCPKLLDGKDKDKFYIFDFCGNFEFFQMNEGRESNKTASLKESLFRLKTQLICQLQSIQYQTDALKQFRQALVEELHKKVVDLQKDHFAVQLHLKYVEEYRQKERWNSLSFEDTLLLDEHLSALVSADVDEISALRFDALLLGLEVALLASKPMSRGKTDLFQKVEEISYIANIPEIQIQHELIQKILNTDYVEKADIIEFEHIRNSLRGLLKFVKKDKAIYHTNFEDNVLDTTWNESELDNDDLKNYKTKAEFYIREHQDHPTISKLKHNVPLTPSDVDSLEDILWSEIGSSTEYQTIYGEKPLGEFVRELVGLDMNTAKEAFGDFLGDRSLDTRQIYFVNQIVEYIVHNGMMKDLSVLQESPFTDKGSVVEIFTDLSLWQGIRSVIDTINKRVAV